MSLKQFLIAHTGILLLKIMKKDFYPENKVVLGIS